MKIKIESEEGIVTISHTNSSGYNSYVGWIEKNKANNDEVEFVIIKTNETKFNGFRTYKVYPSVNDSRWKTLGNDHLFIQLFNFMNQQGKKIEASMIEEELYTTFKLKVEVDELCNVVGVSQQFVESSVDVELVGLLD